MLPTVSVVIPTRDRPEVLQRCLSAVLADEATIEAIVVVDGNDPQTAEMLDGFARRDSRVRITSTPPEQAELGRVQRARDQVATIASSEVILAMDDDVVAHPGLVSGHARWHAGRDDLVVVGYMPPVAMRHWPRSLATVRYYSEAYESHCNRYESNPDLILRMLWGGNLSVRRADWVEALKQPRATTNLFEDRDLGLRLLRDGRTGVFDRTLGADHWYERSLRSFIDRAQRSPSEDAQLRAVHADVLGPTDEGQTVPARASLKLLQGLAESSVGWWLVQWTLITMVFVASLLHISNLEDRILHVLWQVAGESTRQEVQSPA
jgi:glycosyltransferase involved in cell wall biosynthesis